MTTDVTQKCMRKVSQSRSIETKEALIEAATQLFAEKGFHKVNTKEIAKAAGVAIGSFYGYYTDKKQVFIEIVKTYKEALLGAGMCGNSDDFDKSNPGQDYTLEQVINYFINQKIEVAERYPLAFHLEINHIRYRDEEVAALLEDYTQREITLFINYMSRYSDLLRVDDLKLAANVIYQVNDNMIMAHLSGGNTKDAQSLINEYKTMIALYLFKGNKENTV